MRIFKSFSIALKLIDFVFFKLKKDKLSFYKLNKKSTYIKLTLDYIKLLRMLQRLFFNFLNANFFNYFKDLFVPSDDTNIQLNFSCMC